MKTELRQTRDGSPTLFVPELNEHYHSLHGAVTESQHVFIKNGLHFALEKFPKINLLEVGLGTGLNACLTFAHSHASEIQYTALEPFPPETSLLKTLNYGTWVDEKLLHAIHALPFDTECSYSSLFHFRKLKIRIEDFQTDAQFELIYYDAFAPHAQPELWDEPVFKKIFHLITPGGVLVTYCAKGDVKRALKASGFLVQTLPGAPGKREMVRAVKK